MPFSKELLSVLNIQPSELEGLSDKDAHQLIKTKYYRLSREFHPDRNPDSSALERFKIIANAYQKLITTNAQSTDATDDSTPVGFVSEIEQYHKPTPVEIPETAFDNHLRDGIQDAYVRLMTEFLALQTPEEKIQFVNHYRAFLDLKVALDGAMDEILYRHPQYCEQRENETLLNQITRTIRELTLKLYGEEFLNDFIYRDALATGNLGPILATRKLLSPIKALAFMVNGAFLILSTSFQYYCKQGILSLIFELMAIQNGQKSLYQIILFGLKSLTVSALLNVSLLGFCYLPFSVMATLFSLPLIYRGLTLLASPVNTLFRPLAQYFGISPAWFTALSLVALPLLVSGVMELSCLTGFMAVLPWITLALNMANVIGIATLMYKIYEEQKTLGMMMGVLVASSFVLCLFVPAPDLSNSLSTLSDFLMALTDSALLYTAMNTTNHIQAMRDEVYASLPLPQEEIPEAIKTATLLGYSNASTQSNLFFNTPKNAECLAERGRSKWMQACSFFGVEPQTKKQTSKLYGGVSNTKQLLLDNTGSSALSC